MKHIKKGFHFILWFWMLINLGWGLAVGCESPVIILIENLIPWIISVFIVTLIYHLTIKSENSSCHAYTLNWIMVYSLSLCTYLSLSSL